MEGTIILSGEKFKYIITKKRIKNTYIRVDSDETVKVSCPKYYTIAQVEGLLRKEESFIRKAVKKIRDKKTESVNIREFKNGDTVQISGEAVRIAVHKGTENRAVLKDDVLRVYVTDPDNDDLRKNTVETFLDDFAKDMILKTIDEVYPLFCDTVKVKPAIRLRRTRSQWGSCTPSKNALSFNLRLVHYPLQCTRYVVIHEFSHFIHFNHSKEFYSEIEKRMPDYDRWRRILKKSKILM